MNIRIPLLATLFGGILTVSTQAQTITAPTGQSLTITNPVDITVAGGTLNIPADGSFNIGGNPFLRSKTGANIFLGSGAGNTSTTGTNNLFFGQVAGAANTTGTFNLFMGSNAGYVNTSGGRNVFMGVLAGLSNTTGSDNFFLGYNSGAANIAGSYNVYLGTQSGNSAQGDYNTFIGYASGATNAAGQQNTYIGYGANGSNGLVNAVAIGYGATATANSTIVLGEGATTITGKGLGAGTSGLRFANLTSASSTTSVPGGKVLSVDGTGNVVLVQITGATTSSVGSPVPLITTPFVLLLYKYPS